MSGTAQLKGRILEICLDIQTNRGIKVIGSNILC
jgi:hypothetical protein